MDRPLVLVAGDQKEIGFALAATLSLSGYDVVCAADGLAAVELCLDRRPALALLALRMPVMNGWDVLCALRAAPSLAGMPVVAIRAGDEPAGRRRLRKAGFAGHVTCPLTAEEVLHEVGWCLGHFAPAAAEVIAA